MSKTESRPSKLTPLRIRRLRAVSSWGTRYMSVRERGEMPCPRCGRGLPRPDSGPWCRHCRPQPVKISPERMREIAAEGLAFRREIERLQREGLALRRKAHAGLAPLLNILPELWAMRLCK